MCRSPLNLVMFCLALLGACSRFEIGPPPAEFTLTNFKPGKDTVFGWSKNSRGYAIAVTPTAAPKNFYSSYLSGTFRPNGNVCNIAFRALTAPWKINLARDGKVVWRAGSAYTRVRYVDAVKLEPGEKYTLVFTHPGDTTAPVEYADVAVTCKQAEPPPKAVSLAERYQAEVIAPAMARQDEQRIPGQRELIETFTSLAARFRNKASADDAALRAFLTEGLSRAEPVLQKAHGAGITGKRGQLVFANYLAHFAVDLSHAPGRDPRAIVAANNGTCWQQAIVAEFIYRLLSGKTSPVRSLDWVVIGHTVVAGDDFILDTTNNIVIFVSPWDWNGMRPEERIAALKNKAVFGYARDLDLAQHNPHEEALGGREWLRNNWMDLASRWPFTIVCCELNTTRQE